MKLPTTTYQFLESVYLSYFPMDIPDECIANYSNVISYKDFLKRSTPSEKILHGILNILSERIKNKKRYQKLTLVKLIKSQLHPELMSSEVIDKLFFVFQSLIMDASEELGWKLTTLIKDVELNEEQIRWLVDHYDKSQHIVNRLLRYPKVERIIYDWAHKCLKNSELESRKSEFIGIQLNFDKKYKHKDKVAYVWGVHYSKLDETTKKDLLLRATTVDTIEEVIKICIKNQYLDIIQFFYIECE